MATVPDKYDVVINGQGYICADLEEVKAQYGYTPPFVPRTNTQGDYGDNFQDFWMSATQRDWSLGFCQKYFRPNDPASARRFWDSRGIDIAVEGQARLLLEHMDLEFPEGVNGAVPYLSEFATMSATKLYIVDLQGVITDEGAHGSGGFILSRGLVNAGGSLFIATSGGDIRKWDGLSFTNFNTADNYNELAFLNNALYSELSGTLSHYSTTGTQIDDFTWRDPTGQEISVIYRIFPFGGKMGIIVGLHPSQYSFWLWDGTGVSVAAEFPFGFSVYDMAVVNGVVFFVGTHGVDGGGQVQVWYYANGQLDMLWGPTDRPGVGGGTGQGCIAAFGDGFVFLDARNNRVIRYRGPTGGMYELFPFDGDGFGERSMTGGSNGIMIIDGQGVSLSDKGAKWPGYDSGYNAVAEGILSTSLLDFDSSLDKIFRGVKVEFDSATDGDGGEVEVAYKLNELDDDITTSTYTTLTADATSGLEYEITGAVGKSISIQVTLKRSTSTDGPILRRISVRAVPQQAAFRKGTLILSCWGRDGKSPLKLRDETFEPKDGQALAVLLNTAATATSPITITDQFGTITAVIEAERFELRQVRPNEYIAVVPYREV